MRIAKNKLDMLWRVALAMHFTSPTLPATYDVDIAIRWLESKQLIAHRGRFVLTQAGRDLLDQKLDPDKLDMLKRYEQRRPFTP